VFKFHSLRIQCDILKLSLASLDRTYSCMSVKVRSTKRESFSSASPSYYPEETGVAEQYDRRVEIYPHVGLGSKAVLCLFLPTSLFVQ
jgi:hypothetical protein